MNYACVHCRVGIRVIWRIETQFCTIFDISYAQQHQCDIYPSLMSFTFSSRSHLHCWVSSIFITIFCFINFIHWMKCNPMIQFLLLIVVNFIHVIQGHLNVFVSHSCIIECHPFHPMWEISSLSILSKTINFIKLHPCDNFRTQWIWLHRHHEFDFIHQTHFHFMFHLCVQFHVYGQFHESHGFGGFDACCLESFIQFIIFIFFMEFIQILDGEMAQFHPSAPIFIHMVQICSIIVINLKICMDQFPFIHVCSILSNFLSSMWCKFWNKIK